MREMVSVKSEEIRHDLHRTRARLTELSYGLELGAHEEVAQALADLDADLARVEAEVFRKLPNDGIDDVLRLDVAELKDALPCSEPSLERLIQGAVASVSYIERRIKMLESERAAALRRSARRRAMTQALLGVIVAAAPFVLGYARRMPLFASAQVLAGSATLAGALLVHAPI
jgi:hypothetical protein